MSSLITARRPLYVVPCDPYVPHTAADTRPLSVPGSIHHVPCTPHCALHASGPLLSPLSSSGGAASYSALALTGDTPCLIHGCYLHTFISACHSANAARTAATVLPPSRQPRYGALPLPASKPPLSRDQPLCCVCLLSSVTELRHQPGRFLGRE